MSRQVSYTVYLYPDEVAIAKRLQEEGNYISVGYCLEEIIRDHLDGERERLDVDDGSAAAIADVPLDFGNQTAVKSMPMGVRDVIAALRRNTSARR